MQVIWTRRALKNLEEIRSYIAEHDPDAATRIAEKIVAKTDKLAEHAMLGPVGFPRGTRRTVVRWRNTRYLVGYRVLEDRVEILQVLHGRQDRR